MKCDRSELRLIFLLAQLQPAKTRRAACKKPAGLGVEFSLVARAKHPGSVTAIQERHLEAALQFFPLTLIHLDSR